MAEEQAIVEEQIVVEEEASNKCCDNCTDEAKCGNHLEFLSESAGHDVFDHCECVCEVNQSRIQERQELHENTEVDTTKAEVGGFGEAPAEEE